MTTLQELGKTILERTIQLSRQVNSELLEPMSAWLDDPHFMDRYAIVIADDINWAKYKQTQRYNDMVAAHEALRRKFEQQGKQKELRKHYNTLIPKGGYSHSKPTSAGAIHIKEILAPFSPKARSEVDLIAEFESAFKLHLSNRLPWEIILNSQITEQGEQTPFQDLPNLLPTNSRTERIAKFQHLLHMQTDGSVELHQNNHCDKITIKKYSKRTKSNITIKTRSGSIEGIDWAMLSDNQRSKVITDATNGKILCKSG